jgi:transcriptional regulator with XRE-family HTH domain
MGSTLGQRLRTIRTERGLSQADLADALVSPSYVSLIESGKRQPQPDVLDGFAHRLGVSPLYLESGISPEEAADQRLRLDFAEIALRNSSLAEARDYFSSLLTGVTGEIRLGAIWGMARVEEACRNLPAALTHHATLLAAARAGAPGAPPLLTLLNGICRIYRDAGDLTRSIQAGEEALQEAGALGLERTEAGIRLASTLVASYSARGDTFSAQHLANQVIARATELNSRTARGAAYWNACFIAADRGELTLAVELAAKTLALLSEAAQDVDVAEIRVTYAWLLLQLEPPRLDEAEALLAAAHPVLAEMSLAQDLTSCETEMARAAMLRGDFSRAVQFAGQAVARCEGSTGRALEDARVVRGLALIMTGAVHSGAAEVAAAASRLAHLGARREAARASRELAEALLRCGRPDDAVPALRRATELAGAGPVTAGRPGSAMAN